MFDFLENDAVEVAKQLLGYELLREFPDGTTARVRIVETEAYHQTDAASHSYKGRTPRTDVMFGPSGHLYVYFTYGMHYCCNIVTGPEGVGAAVLIRAVEPLEGVEALERHRPMPGTALTNGPAKLCQALDIDKRMNGHDVRTAPLRLVKGAHYTPEEIITTPRIGIRRAIDTPWRFYVKGNPFVSKP